MSSAGVTDANCLPAFLSDSRNTAVRRSGGVEACNRCGAAIAANEPLCLVTPGWSTGWTYYVGIYTDPETGMGYRGRIVKDKGGMCLSCAGVSEVQAGRFADKDELNYYRQAPCDTCERLVLKPENRVRIHAFCSPVCEERYYNGRRSRRRAAEREKVCEVCGERFTATRTDAKTCGPACKQKAYRTRKREGG